MVDTVGIIQCRLDSSRLPGKALMDLHGASVLEWVVRRSRLAQSLDKLVLATTYRPGDDPVAEAGARLGLPVVRGDCDNLMLRFAQTLKAHPAKVAVRITADNPFTCPEAVDAVVRAVHGQGAEYGYAAGIPYGAGADAFDAGLLTRLAEQELTGRQREHLNLHVLENHLFYHIASVPLLGAERRTDVRVTLDTPEDMRRLTALFDGLEDPLHCGVGELISAWDGLPDSVRTA